MARQKYMYMATLDRFGYDLTVIETTKEKARAALIEEYIRAFKQRNGIHPAEEESDRWGTEDHMTWLEVAEEDIITERFTIGEVEWR